MNIYKPNDFDIVYNINADYSKQVINYPIYLSQYSSDIYIRLNLFDNEERVRFDYFDSISLYWYNYSVKNTFILTPDYVSENKKSVYFKINSDKTNLYNKWAATTANIVLTKNGKDSVTDVQLIVERNPIQK